MGKVLILRAGKIKTNGVENPENLLGKVWILGVRKVKNLNYRILENLMGKVLILRVGIDQTNLDQVQISLDLE